MAEEGVEVMEEERGGGGDGGREGVEVMEEERGWR